MISKEAVKRFYYITNRFSELSSSDSLSPCQWIYLQGICSDDGKRLIEEFNEGLYLYLGEYGNDELVTKYKEFYCIRKMIKTKIIVKTPFPYRINEAIKQLNIILNFQDNLKWADDLVKRRNEEQSLVYGDEKYIVLMPSSVQEVIDEALIQYSHLIILLDSFVNGSINILFLRRASSLNEPYVSFVVRDGCIANIYDQQGRLPCISVIDFLEKRYSKAMGFKINPWEIINGAFEDMDYSEGYTDQHLQELKTYAEEYKTEHGLIEDK